MLRVIKIILRQHQVHYVFRVDKHACSLGWTCTWLLILIQLIWWLDDNAVFLHETAQKLPNAGKWPSSIELSTTTSSIYNWNFCCQTSLKSLSLHYPTDRCWQRYLVPMCQVTQVPSLWVLHITDIVQSWLAVVLVFCVVQARGFATGMAMAIALLGALWPLMVLAVALLHCALFTQTSIHLKSVYPSSFMTSLPDAHAWHLCTLNFAACDIAVCQHHLSITFSFCACLFNCDIGNYYII